MYVVFFFFKQKTAYEMRISDWSSDVCSSDLLFRPHLRPRAQAVSARGGAPRLGAARPLWRHAPDRASRSCRRTRRRGRHRDPRTRLSADRRSEEHTSELQSLMRISYAVFCLKKKNNKNK